MRSEPVSAARGSEHDSGRALDSRHHRRPAGFIGGAVSPLSDGGVHSGKGPPR